MNKELNDAIKKAKTGYKAAISAIPYMPKESRPYTIATAERYLDELNRLINRQNSSNGN